MDFFSILLSSVIVAFVILLLIPVALHIGLVDKPCERKDHEGQVPLIGGVAIFISLSMTLLLNQSISFSQYRALFAASIVIILVGVLDDLKELKPSTRFFFEILSALILIYWGGLELTRLGDLFGFGDMGIAPVSVLVTVISIVGIINAMNMVDGIDGLAGLLSLSVIFPVAFLLFDSGDSNSAFILFLLAGSIVGFLFFNLPGLAGSRKVFLGDAGSMLIGLFLVWFLIRHSQGANAAFSPVVVLWFVAVPLIDTFAVMIRRSLKGKSPFEADRNHFHHILQRLGVSSAASTWSIFLISMLTSSVGLLGHYYSLSDPLLFLSFFMIFVVYFYWSDRILRIFQTIKPSS